MKFKDGTLAKLAEMICGNEPFLYFPYRSSSYLTKFFNEIELDYKHDGSTRSAWVEDVLKELNNISSKYQELPSKEMIKFIENLIDQDKYIFDDKLDLKKARDDVNRLLKNYGLKLSISQNGSTRVVSETTSFISTDTDSIPERAITFSPAVFKVPQKEVNS